MIKFAVTGGIGSGKSTVCNILKRKNIPIFNCDDAARLARTNPTVVDQIVTAFGKGVLSPKPYSDTGEQYLDAAKLADIVFADVEEMEKLVEIVHPRVNTMMEEFFYCQEREGCECVGVENSILFEMGMEDNFDHVLVIDVPENIRIERVMKRDHVSEGEVRHRMAFQLSDMERQKKSDFLIYNYDDHDIEKQVDVFLKRIEFDDA